MAKNKFRIEMQIRRWHLLIFIFSCADALFYFVIELLPKAPSFPINWKLISPFTFHREIYAARLVP